jgi:hypothetical protein
MRENRTSGSEGGGAELNRLSLPLSLNQQTIYRPEGSQCNLLLGH